MSYNPAAGMLASYRGSAGSGLRSLSPQHIDRGGVVRHDTQCAFPQTQGPRSKFTDPRLARAGVRVGHGNSC
eukprot:1437827-Rhodomonas_salina.2